MISLIKMKGVNPQTKEVIYFPRWTRVSTVRETQLSKRMARGSTFSVGEINGVFADFPQSIIDELLNGNAVSIDGLGVFKLKVSGKSQKEKKDVTSAGAKISVVFEPAAELDSRLANESEFRFVEVPTAEGQQDANDEEPGTGGGESGGGDEPGGGGESATVAAPEITGDTPFADTATVTITAEQGAEIRYTTDGSTPTASSTLYSSSITLSDTATVKAIAIKNGTSSEVATKAFVKSSGNGGGFEG